MQSKVDICNRALTFIGQTRLIRSLDEPSVEARILSRHYDASRHEVLSMNAWNWASDSTRLAEYGDIHPADCSHAYAVPTGCLKLISLTVNDLPVDYAVRYRGKPYIATDATDPLCLYVYDVTDTADFPSLFADLLAWRIALNVAEALTGEATVRGDILPYYMEAQRAAVNMDAAQAFESPRRWADDYIAVRG